MRGRYVEGADGRWSRIDLVQELDVLHFGRPDVFHGQDLEKM